jgi:RND family efflux transporter MFP subunit
MPNRPLARALSLLALLLAGPGASVAEVPFPTAPAEARPVPRERLLDGVVEAVNESTVSAQTAGTVTALYFDVNDYVANGAVLLEISATEQQAALAQAQANLDEAEARYEEALADQDRIQRIFAEGAVSRSEMDEADAALSAARARLEAARAGKSRAEQQLEYTKVAAPYSGIVTTRHVEVGEQVQPGVPLMTGISLEDLRVSVDVPQDLIEEVRSSGVARVRVPGPERRVVVAERLTFFPYANPRAHTFRVRVYLPGDDTGLYPGMYVKVGFVLGQEPRLLVPKAALVYRGEVTGVYVVDPQGRVALRMVRVGHEMDAGMIEVLAGLEAGERVALDPIAAGAYLKERTRTETHS